MRDRNRGPLLLLLLTGGVVEFAKAQSDPPDNLRGELPLRLEDALIARTPGVSLLNTLRYNRTHRGLDQWVFRPQVQYAVARGWQLDVTSTLLGGPADRDGSGDIEFGIAHQFLEERGPLPHLGLSANIVAPSGRNSAGADTQVEFLATKTVNRGPGQDRLHFNGGWLRNAASDRKHRYEIITGYSRRLGKKTVILGGYALEQDEGSNVEIGLRQRMSEQLIVSIGIGRGFAGESPRGRVTVGIEWHF